MNSVAARAALAAAVVVPAVAPSSARDYAGVARNVIPSGQYGFGSPPPAADDQALMYDGLTPLFGSVRELRPVQVLQARGVRHPRPGAAAGRADAAPGLRIVRDRWNVPHITGRTRADVMWGAGWVTGRTASC